MPACEYPEGNRINADKAESPGRMYYIGNFLSVLLNHTEITRVLKIYADSILRLLFPSDPINR